MPIGKFLRNGYLIKGDTLPELAKNAGIDAAGLEATVREYNEGAVKGEDPAFGRGSTSFNRYLADSENKPNPCVAVHFPNAQSDVVRRAAPVPRTPKPAMVLTSASRRPWKARLSRAI